MRNNLVMRGFTLVELMVVAGMLTMILTVVLMAINPGEQLNKTSDVAAKKIVEDFVAANVDYRVAQKTNVWEKDTDCGSEMAAGGALIDMPSCLTALTEGGKMQEDYTRMEHLDEIWVNKCDDSVVLCYNPRSKQVNLEASTKYTKFGVNDPGCPGTNGVSADCYWCRPLNNSRGCMPSPTPPPSSTPTPTAAITPTSIPTPTTAPLPTPFVFRGYPLDGTKLLRTYAFFSFDPPAFGPNYRIDISTDGNFVAGSPTTYLGFAWCHNGEGGTPTSPSYKALKQLTGKLICFQSLPYYNHVYNQSCGKTIYWRVVNDNITSLMTQTYETTEDCVTNVNAFSNSNDWYKYYPYINADGTVRTGQPYDPEWDPNGDGKTDWVDYWILAMETRTRFGGWSHPE